MASRVGAAPEWLLALVVVAALAVAARGRRRR